MLEMLQHNFFSTASQRYRRFERRLGHLHGRARRLIERAGGQDGGAAGQGQPGGVTDEEVRDLNECLNDTRNGLVDYARQVESLSHALNTPKSRFPGTETEFKLLDRRLEFCMKQVYQSVNRLYAVQLQLLEPPVVRPTA